MHISFRGILLLISLLFAVSVSAVEQGTLIKQEDVKAEPYRDAKTIGTLKRNAPVDILKRSSGWMQISFGKKKGWVRMLSVRLGTGTTAKAGAGQEVKGVLSLASGRAGKGSVVSTTGIRGLSEEDLKSAKFDEAQIKKDESFMVSKDEANKFAAQGKLRSQHVDYLPEPSSGTGE